jgi:hypothetical protein
MKVDLFSHVFVIYQATILYRIRAGKSRKSFLPCLEGILHIPVGSSQTKAAPGMLVARR